MFSNPLNNFKYALKGIEDVWKHTPNMRIHGLAAFLVILAAIGFKVSLLEWQCLVLCVFLVLAAETFNTAIEYLTNLVSPNYHVLAGKTKDAAAGAVLLTAIGAAIVGGIIFIPKVWILINAYF